MRFPDSLVRRAGGGTVKIGIIGTRGQLGADLCIQAKGSDIVKLDRPEFDLLNPDSFDFLGEIRPDILINTAAYNDVDKAEADVDSAFRLNAFAPACLADYCRNEGIRFITFSTDYVFGDQHTKTPLSPLKETDEALPLSSYGVSKWAGERMVLNRNPDAIVIRTCGLYGHHRAVHLKRNFVDLMLQLGLSGKTIRVVSDQVLTPTSTLELAKNVMSLLAVSPEGGVYHMTNEGQCSWFEFAREIFSIAGIQADLREVTQKEYGAKARRPSYSVLSKEKIGRFGIRFGSWQDALSTYLQDKNLSERQPNP